MAFSIHLTRALASSPCSFRARLLLYGTGSTAQTKGIPVGMPYLEGFPPDDELPGVSWIAKVVATLARTLLGAIRYRWILFSTTCRVPCTMVYMTHP